MNTKQQARLGLFHLKEAVLKGLLNEGPLKQDEIRKRLGIPQVLDGEPGDRRNSIISATLYHLRNEGRVEYTDNGWKITEEEASLLSETQDDNE